MSQLHSLLRRSPAAALLALVACGEAPPSSAEPGSEDRIGGGQTTDFGSGDQDECLVLSSEPISLEQARARGHAVDAQLARLPARQNSPFHRGPYPCDGVPDVSGTITIDSTLVRIIEQQREPAPGVPEAVRCPDLLRYELRLQLVTDEGTLSGDFVGEAFGDDEQLFAFASAPIEDVSGSLGVRADVTRPHRVVANAQLRLGSSGSSGSAFISVSYDDGRDRDGDQGEAIFWPVPSDGSECDGGLPGDGVEGAELIGIDAYRALH